MDEAKVVEVLRRVEWVGGPLLGWECPWCEGWKEDGHADDCKLAALLSEGGREQADRVAGEIAALVGRRHGDKT